jgi:sarcosine oxidase
VRRFDVVVIGTGAMGAATAWHLARRGCSVLAVEQFEQGHTRGSSHGGVRIFRYTYPAPYYTALTQQALPWWRVLEDEAAETLLDLNGVYDHGRPDLLAPLADSLQACGVPHEWLTPDEAHARVPGLRFDTAVLHHASGGRTFAHSAVQALVRLARHHGAEVRFECPATLRVVGDHVEVDLGDEVVWAHRAVVTAGAWVGTVLSQGVLPADAHLPQLVVTEEQLAHYVPHDTEAVWPSFMHHTDRFRYGLFTPGEGLKVGGHHEGLVTSIDERRHGVDQASIDEIRRYVTDWVPGVEPEPRFGATCLYTTTANEDFVIDRVGPVVIGSPCSGHGFKFVPLVGHLLARLAADDQGDVPVHEVVDARHRLAAFA